LPRRIINGYPHGHIVGMVVNAGFGHVLAGCFGKQHRVGDGLHPVGGPRFRDAVGAPGAAALVLVGNQLAVAPAQVIDFAEQPEGFALDLDAAPLGVLVGVDGGVQLAPCKHGRVGYANLLDFFQIEQAFAVQQRMQGHHPKGRFVGHDFSPPRARKLPLTEPRLETIDGQPCPQVHRYGRYLRPSQFGRFRLRAFTRRENNPCHLCHAFLLRGNREPSGRFGRCEFEPKPFGAAPIMLVVSPHRQAVKPFLVGTDHNDLPRHVSACYNVQPIDQVTAFSQ
jgi:hypothetical protein